MASPWSKPREALRKNASPPIPCLSSLCRSQVTIHPLRHIPPELLPVPRSNPTLRAKGGSTLSVTASLSTASTSTSGLSKDGSVDGGGLVGSKWRLLSSPRRGSSSSASSCELSLKGEGSLDAQALMALGGEPGTLDGLSWGAYRDFRMPTRQEASSLRHGWIPCPFVPCPLLVVCYIF